MTDQPTDPVVEAINGLRDDLREAVETVRDEQVGRATTEALAKATRALGRKILGVGAAVLVVFAIVAWALIVDYIGARTLSCPERDASRADAREGLVRISAELSKDDVLTPKQEQAREAAARKIALAAYPPLNC